MPPPGSGKAFNVDEQEIVRRWIAEGAKFQKHWAFVKPSAPKIPAINKPELANDPLDHFVIQGLQKEGLQIASTADRYTIARRISLDLVGLPPSIEQVDRFVNDTDENALEKYIDSVMAQPTFGERWARIWLDLARYADSQGYAQDSGRTIWRYRDWVIQAINENKTFDEFTIEQIAGDMLPDPTDDQLIATAFHRNTMTNSEGGTDNEEFRNAAVVDRVNTTMQVWMGVTMGCAQCHTHKYDPISHEEYFKFFAIFNQSEDADRNDESPLLRRFSDAQMTRKTELEKKIADLEKVVAKQNAESKSKNKVEIPDTDIKTRFVRVQQLGKGQFLHLAEVQVFSGNKNLAREGTASQISTGFGGPANFGNDGNTSGVFTDKSVTHTDKADNPWWEIDLKKSSSIDKIKIWNRLDGVETRLNNWRVIALDENRKPLWIHVTKKTPIPNVEFAIPKRLLS